MPASFASVPQLEAASIEALTARQLTVAPTRLAQASRHVRKRLPEIDVWVADGRIDPALVADVVCDMVLRYFANPEGKSEESIDDYSYVRDSAVSDGSIRITDDEIDLLTPDDDVTPSANRAFSLDLSSHEPSYLSAGSRRWRPWA